jgi:hypothetical protein
LIWPSVRPRFESFPAKMFKSALPCPMRHARQELSHAKIAQHARSLPWRQKDQGMSNWLRVPPALPSVLAPIRFVVEEAACHQSDALVQGQLRKAERQSEYASFSLVFTSSSSMCATPRTQGKGRATVHCAAIRA